MNMGTLEASKINKDIIDNNLVYEAVCTDGKKYKVLGIKPISFHVRVKHKGNIGLSYCGVYLSADSIIEINKKSKKWHKKREEKRREKVKKYIKENNIKKWNKNDAYNFIDEVSFKHNIYRYAGGNSTNTKVNPSVKINEYFDIWVKTF